MDYADGKTIAHIAWSPPRPGASILRKVALPLGVAVTLIAVIAAVLARYTSRSAERLERALEAAQAADRIKTDFLSNVSHELRTPMNGIIGVAQILAIGRLDEEQRELVRCPAGLGRLRRLALINDLLDITQMDSGNRALDHLPFAPGRTLRQIVELMRPAAARRGLALESDLSDLDGLTLVGDERALRQIVTNLLGNAVKFTGRGTVGLDCEVTGKGEPLSSCSACATPAPASPTRIASASSTASSRWTPPAREPPRARALALRSVRASRAMMGGRIELEASRGWVPPSSL